MLFIDQKASVQFDGDRAIHFRVIRALEPALYDEWVWLDGYQLNLCGDAVLRREIYVQIAGLKKAELRPGRPSAQQEC